MNKNEAVARYHEANRLYDRMQYQDALDILDALDIYFPDDRKILFARAKCCLKLNRPEEARTLAGQLAIKYDDAKAKALLATMEHTGATASEIFQDDASVFALDNTPATMQNVDVISSNPLPKPAQAPVTTSNKKRYIIAVCAVLLLVLALLPVFLNPAENTPSQRNEPTTTGTDLPPAAPILWYTDYEQGVKAAINRNSALLAFIHDSGDESARIFEEVFNNEEVKRGAERCISLRINSEDGTLGVFAEQVDQMPAVILTYPDGQQAHLYFAQGEDISISELSEKLSNVKAGTSPQKSTPSYESKNSIFAFYRHFDRMPFLLQLIIYALLISFTGWVGRKLEGSQEELEGIAALIAKIISLFFSIICILLIIGLVIELILDIRDMFRMILWRLGFYGF